MYYPKYQSFINRIDSCKTDDSSNAIILKTKRGDEYYLENNINEIDFLKIDTEGYEYDVITGFGEKIKNVKIIQFEYGGTFLDRNIKLIELINYLKNKDFFIFVIYLKIN